MSGLNYYVLDCETTGLSSSYHEITELSIIRVTDRMQLTRLVKCKYPRRANFDALRITGKTMADLYKGHSPESVVKEANRFFHEDGGNPNGRCVIAFNHSFDERFCKQLWKNYNQIFPADLWLDPWAMIKKYAKENGWHDNGKVKLNLTASCDRLGLKRFSAHSASGDTRRTYLLYKHLINEFGIDYLPFIKTKPHNIESPKVEEEDMSLLDGMDDVPF